MKTKWKRVLALLLGLCITFNSSAIVWAFDEKDSNVIDGEIELEEKTANSLVTSMFGEPLEEGVKTDEGYQYKVSGDAFDSIKEQIDEKEKLEQDQENLQDPASGNTSNNENQQSAVNPDNTEVLTKEDNSNELQEDNSNELPENYVDNSNQKLYELLEKAESTDAKIAKASSDTKKVEIVFVIDSTGSMAGSIADVKNNVAEFAQYLSDQDIALRLGLIDYRDIEVDGSDSTIVHSADHSNWMNVTQFINALTEVKANGGGDRPETPIDALGHLTEGTVSWSSDAYKFGVLITDASYKSNNNHGISDMSDMIQRLQKRDIQISTIVNSSSYSSYGELAGLTGGIQADLYDDFSKVLREYADAVIGGSQPTQDYSVRILEETTGLPIRGAVITWNGGSSSPTDKNGMTVLTTRNNPIRSVSVSCVGYNSIEKDQLELVSQGCVDLTMTINEDEATAAEDGVPVITPAMFQSPKSGNDTAKAPYIEILGKRFNLFDALSLSFDFNPFGEKLNISHNKEEKTYEIIIGKNFKGKNEDNRGYWEDSYEQYKSIVQSFSKKSAKEIYNDFRTIRKNAKSKEDFLFPIDVYVGGYAKASYASGTMDMLEGGVVVGANRPNDIELFKWRLPPVPIAFFKLSFNYEAKANVALITVEPGKLYGISNSTINFTPKLKGTINAGVERIATIGGGLQGDLATEINFPFKKFSDSVSAELKGKLIFYMKLLGYSADADIPLGDISIYPGSKSKSAMLAQLDKNDFKLIERPKSSKVKTSEQSSEYIYQKTHTYSDNTPQLIQMKDGRWILTWVDAAPNRDDVNMTAIYYSISEDGGNWSAPKIVADDGTGDFMPTLGLAGDGTPILAWQNSSKVYNNKDLSLQDRAKGIDISVATFDADSGQFNKPTVIPSGENETCELALQVVPYGSSVALYWLENSQNDLLLDSGENQIRTTSLDLETQTWTEPKTIVGSLKAINNFSAGEINSQPYIVYSIEGENIVKYYNQTENTLESITSDTPIINAKIDEGRLYWSDSSGLYSWDSSSITKESDILTGTNFDIVQDGSMRLAILNVSDGITNELWASMNNGSGWTNPTPLTDYHMSISSASPVLKDNVLYWAVGRTEVDEKTDTFGATDLIVDNTAFTPDISVNDESYVSELENSKDGNLDVLIDITNEGLADEGQLKAVFYRNNSRVGESELLVVDEEDISKNPTKMTKISAGEQLLTMAKYQLPSEQKEHKLEIRITNPDESTVYGKTHVTIPAATADLKVSNVSVVREGSDAVVSAIITNDGLATANVNAILSQEGIKDTETKKVGKLAPNENVSVKFIVKSDKLVAENLYDYKRFTVTAQSDAYENMTGNNSGSALLEPLSIEKISIKGSKNLALNVGESYICEYDIAPTNAAKGTVVWMSDNTDIATVKDGKIQALKAGTVNITALTTNTKGEQFKDTITVDVSGEKEIAVKGINIEPTKLQVDKNKSIEITAQILPENATNQNIKWTTDQEGIVQLSPVGKGSSVNVKGISEGTVTLIGETEDGGYTDSVVIEVKELPDIEPKYNITIQKSEYGEISCDYSEANVGETISLNVSPKEGYILSNIQVIDKEGHPIDLKEIANGYSFVMPSSDVSIIASFAKQPSEEKIYHTLTFEVNEGEHMNAISKEAGTVISLNQYVPKKEGYEFKGWYLDSELSEEVTEIQLTKDITVYAKWEKVSDSVVNEDDKHDQSGSNTNTTGKNTIDSDSDNHNVNTTKNDGTSAAQTGDRSQILLWVVIGGIALFTCGITLIVRRKKH